MTVGEKRIAKQRTFFTDQSCDSVFDDGSLKDDPEKAGQVMQNLLAVTTTTNSEKTLPKCSPLVEVHNLVWFGIAKVTHQLNLLLIRASRGWHSFRNMDCNVRLANLVQAPVRDSSVP